MQGGVSDEEEPTTLCTAFAKQVLSGLCVLHACVPYGSPISLQRDQGLGRAGLWEQGFRDPSSSLTGSWEEPDSSLTLKCSEDRTGSVLQELVQALRLSAGCPEASSLTSLCSSVFRNNGNVDGGCFRRPGTLEHFAKFYEQSGLGNPNGMLLNSWPVFY